MLSIILSRPMRTDAAPRGRRASRRPLSSAPTPSSVLISLDSTPSRMRSSSTFFVISVASMPSRVRCRSEFGSASRSAPPSQPMRPPLGNANILEGGLILSFEIGGGGGAGGQKPPVGGSSGPWAEKGSFHRPACDGPSMILPRGRKLSLGERGALRGDRGGVPAVRGVEIPACEVFARGVQRASLGSGGATLEQSQGRSRLST
mmetsp:Transcript_75134/g.141690  ORF Transcript_75134/g.141690 Transcript_75134/m.141690 type:complete len:204 (+) Transcript_75134:866-1477(+)